MYSVRYTDTANQCFAALTPEQRREIIRIVTLIQLDPVPDNRVKITLHYLGAMYTLYRDHRGYWVTYHVAHNEINVVGVGYGSPYVPLPPSR